PLRAVSSSVTSSRRQAEPDCCACSAPLADPTSNARPAMPPTRVLRRAELRVIIGASFRLMCSVALKSSSSHAKRQAPALDKGELIVGQLRRVAHGPGDTKKSDASAYC